MIKINDYKLSYKVIPIIIVTLLLFLRFPFIFAVTFEILPLDINIVNSIFINGTYLLTSILIIYERKNLSQFNFIFFR